MFAVLSLFQGEFVKPNGIRHEKDNFIRLGQQQKEYPGHEEFFVEVLEQDQ